MSQDLDMHAGHPNYLGRQPTVHASFVTNAFWEDFCSPVSEADAGSLIQTIAEDEGAPSPSDAAILMAGTAAACYQLDSPAVLNCQMQ